MKWVNHLGICIEKVEPNEADSTNLVRWCPRQGGGGSYGLDILRHIIHASKNHIWVVATQTFLEFSPRNLGKISSKIWRIFFRWVETTNQTIPRHPGSPNLRMVMEPTMRGTEVIGHPQSSSENMTGFLGHCTDDWFFFLYLMSVIVSALNNSAPVDRLFLLKHLLGKKM